MAGSFLYKTAHCNYRNTTRPYPLIPQVMNGTGALRQFVPKVVRHSSRAALGYWPSADRVLHDMMNEGGEDASAGDCVSIAAPFGDLNNGFTRSGARNFPTRHCYLRPIPHLTKYMHPE
jgi:hypothetical protein